MGAIRSLTGVQNQQQFIVPTLNFDFYSATELNLGGRLRDDPRQQWNIRKNHHRLDLLGVDFLKFESRRERRAETKLRIIGA